MEEVQSKNELTPKTEERLGLKNVEPDVVIESDDEDTHETALNLSKQNLTEIPEDVAKAKGDGTLTLILTRNNIKSLKNLEYFPRLERLELDRNGLKNLDDLPRLPCLRTLWLNTNELSDLQSLVSTLQKQCPRLEYLSLLKNPLCPSVYFDHDNESRYKRYRHMVLYNLKGITFLDTTKVTPEERKEAEERGKFLVVKRPDSKQKIETENETENGTEKDENQNTETTSEYPMSEPSAFLGKGKSRYDGKESEGNRFILNTDL